MDFFPLPLFPEGSLRESVVTTVWVGVFMISFFNLRFGWTYSGLVVPGYLVPLLLTNPVSACFTVIEGVLAYGVVRLVSDHLSQAGGWCGFFGRDRFFALFLSAVLVRVIVDGWCLPALASWLQVQWNLTLDYKGAFHSFGLIIIALIANQFWKTGFWRGVTPFAVTLAITFVIIRFVLMTATNFNVGHMAYMYSNTAASLLASPKSYIILIVTGFVASRMNLRYGWEYNGILIPALLALQWYEPLKIVSSLAEAAVVYIVSDWLLQTRWFRGITMEGARKLLLFFNVAYAYRLVLGWVVPLLFPGAEVNDYYGFAYLLSSLIALKMHSKHIVLRLARATLQTSFAAAVAANLIGLWLASLLGSISVRTPAAAIAMAPLTPTADSLELLVAQENLRLFRKGETETVQMPPPPELNRFEEALEQLHRHVETGQPEPLNQARRYLRELRYRVDLVQSNRLCLREEEPNRGWGMYVIELRQPNGLLLEVPAPLEEWGAVESALRLYDRLNASALAIAGASRFANKDGSSDVLANSHTPFQAFHRVFGRRNVMQVRGYTPKSARRLPGAESNNMLFVKAELPRSLSLSALQTEVGDYDVIWRPAPLANAQQRRSRAGFAELWLTRASRVQLKAELAARLEPVEPAVPKDSLVLEWLILQKRALAKDGSNKFIPASPEEMRYFDQEILTPMLETARTEYDAGGLTPEGWRSVTAMNWSAAVLGYQVCCRHDPSLDQDFLILAESPRANPRRHWGTFVIRLGDSTPFAIQVPRPLFDFNSLECGVHLFERLQAESILLAGSHNEANRDQTADVLDFRNRANLFSLVSQVVMRQAGDQWKMAVQCRGYASPPDVPEPPEILVAFQDGIQRAESLTPLGKTLTRSLAADGFRFQFVDGSPLSAGYEISCVPQAQYVIEAARKEFAILWLSSGLRDAFRLQEQDDPVQVQLRSVGIPVVAEDLRGWLNGRLALEQKTLLPPALKAVLDHYVRTLDIVSLQKAMQEFPQFKFTAMLNRNSRQIFLLISDSPTALPAVLNLAGRAESPKPPNQTGQMFHGGGNGPAASARQPYLDLERIECFLASRGSWLEWPL